MLDFLRYIRNVAYEFSETVVGADFIVGRTACGSHLDLGCAPYVLYGVKYIDLVSLAPLSGVCAVPEPEVPPYAPAVHLQSHQGPWWGRWRQWLVHLDG